MAQGSLVYGAVFIYVTVIHVIKKQQQKLFEN